MPNKYIHSVPDDVLLKGRIQGLLTQEPQIFQRLTLTITIETLVGDKRKQLLFNIEAIVFVLRQE
jgi:hypothetical protein